MKKCMALMVFMGWASLAQGMTADEVVNKANEASYYAGEDGRSKVTMTIKDASGGTRNREFAILRKNTGGESQKFYVYFQEPSDVRKMAYMVWKAGGGKDDDRWLYMPALSLVRRIAPGDKRTSFVGSDFVYEDVSGRDPQADTHELLDETDAQYVIRNIPKDAGSVEFSEYTVWIDKDSFLPRKAEYLDKQGKLYRRVSAESVKTIDGIPTVIRSVVEDLNSGSSTINEFSDVKYNLGLKENIFTERYLRRPPREVR
ncbi:MAG: outer membrane lipoprotein-sorting protein [Spartobacteria bacterium]|nr:outer membrane lipoprotein-sorting protein [Spartobacteria bacterium]